MKDRGKQSLYASGEDYLEAILVLKKQKGMVRSVDVARHLEVTKLSSCFISIARSSMPSVCVY